MPPKAYADLHNLPEDDRIQIIGSTAEAGEIVGFFVDDNPKADRYIEKLLRNHKVRVVKRVTTHDGIVLVQVGPAES